jgi:hypothetical protein
MNRLAEVFPFRYVTCVLLFIGIISPATFAIDEQIKPIETTMAYELFTTERGVRKVPVDAEKLLRSALDDATKMAANTARYPGTRDQALVALEAIQLALVKHNFLQPPEEKDWPQTLGIALTPRTFSDGDLKAILSFPDNAKRKPYLDLTKPLYFVTLFVGISPIH